MDSTTPMRGLDQDRYRQATRTDTCFQPFPRARHSAIQPRPAPPVDPPLASLDLGVRHSCSTAPWPADRAGSLGQTTPGLQTTWIPREVPKPGRCSPGVRTARRYLPGHHPPPDRRYTPHPQPSHTAGQESPSARSPDPQVGSSEGLPEYHDSRLVTGRVYDLVAATCARLSDL